MMWKTHFLNLDFAPWEAFVIGTCRTSVSYSVSCILLLRSYAPADDRRDSLCVLAFYSTLKLPLEVPTDEALIDEQLPPEPTDPMVRFPSPCYASNLVSLSWAFCGFGQIDRSGLLIPSCSPSCTTRVSIDWRTMRASALRAMLAASRRSSGGSNTAFSTF
jgi:hypothetical protein